MSSEYPNERYKDFQFIASPELVDGDLELKLDQTCPYNPVKEHVPMYRFSMVGQTYNLEQR